jgi:hypothetical protein
MLPPETIQVRIVNLPQVRPGLGYQLQFAAQPRHARGRNPPAAKTLWWISSLLARPTVGQTVAKTKTPPAEKPTGGVAKKRTVTWAER